MKLYRLVCDIHAPRFWKSEPPPPRFAHTPLPTSIRATVSPSTCFILRTQAAPMRFEVRPLVSHQTDAKTDPRSQLIGPPLAWRPAWTAFREAAS
jgi:hypothetical protein